MRKRMFVCLFISLLILSVQIPFCFATESPAISIEGFIEETARIEGYSDEEALHQVIMVTNNNPNPVTLENPYSTGSGFDVGTILPAVINYGESATFSCNAKHGLTVGTYKDTITIPYQYNGQSYTVTQDICFTVEPLPSIEPAVLDLGTVPAGSTNVYGTVRITNNSSIFALDIMPTSSNNGYFKRDPQFAGYPDIEPGEFMDVPVYAVEPLLPGTYEDTFEILCGWVDQNLNIPVKLVVEQLPYHLLSMTNEPIDFGIIFPGETPNSQALYVKNIGSNALTLYQPTTQYVDIGILGNVTINPNSIAAYQIVPKTNLAPGDYSEIITVPASNGASATALVQFTITDGTFALEATPNIVDLGYLYESEVSSAYLYPEQVVEIKNTGTAAGNLYFEPWTTGSFNIYPLDDCMLPAGESVSLTIKPNEGLPVGIHETLFTVNGSNGASADINIRFEVKEGNGNDIYATPLRVGYSSVFPNNPNQPSQEIKIVNNSASTIALAQPVSTIMEVSQLSKTELASGESIVFSVSPKSSMPQGDHFETMIIQDASGQQLATVDLNYTMMPAGHKITLHQGEGYQLVTSDVSQYQESFVPHGGTYVFCVQFMDHYKPGDEYVVKMNGTPITADVLTATGWYTLFDVTEDIDVTVEGVESRPFTYPEDLTNITGNAFGGRLNNTNDFLFGDLLKREEEWRIDEQNAKYIVWLEVDDVTENTQESDKQIIQSVETDAVITNYLDINLMKQVGEEKAKKIEEPGGQVSITIEIPEELCNVPEDVNRDFGVIRLHEGVPEKIQGTVADGTNLMTFSSDQFSTYAIFYEDELMDEPENTPTTSPSVSPSVTPTSTPTVAPTATPTAPVQTPTPSVPKTGDSSPLMVWVSLAVISAMLLVVLERKQYS